MEDKTKRSRRGRPPKAKFFTDSAQNAQIEPKDRIKKVAIKLFYMKGFHGASIREIAEAAEVTKPVIYYHYESKKGLYKSILRDSMSEIFEIYARHVSHIDEEVPCKILKKATTEIFAWTSKNRERMNMIIFTLTTRDEAFKDVCEEYLATRDKILRPIFEKGVKTGNLPYKDIKTANLAFSGLIIGFELFSSVFEENYTTDENANKIIDLLIGQCK